MLSTYSWIYLLAPLCLQKRPQESTDAATKATIFVFHISSLSVCAVLTRARKTSPQTSPNLVHMVNMVHLVHLVCKGKSGRGLSHRYVCLQTLDFACCHAFIWETMCCTFRGDFHSDHSSKMGIITTVAVLSIMSSCTVSSLSGERQTS